MELSISPTLPFLLIIGLGKNSTRVASNIIFATIALLATKWTKKGPKLVGDITGDGTVNMVDLKVLAEQWLRIGSTYNPSP